MVSNVTIPNVEKELERILKFIQNIKEKTGADGFVVALSGGIDSALTATLCVRASNKDSVLGLLLPCHSRKEDLEDAMLMVEFLGIRHHVVDLTTTYDELIKSFKSGELERLPGRTLEETLEMRIMEMME